MRSAHGGTFRFNILNKESGEDLFFGENSPYHEGELLIYIISSLPLSNDPSDTIFHYSVRGINSDKGRIFTTFLSTSHVTDSAYMAYVRIRNDIDTLITYPRLEGYYDRGDCKKLVLDKIFYNGRLICDACEENEIYLIHK